MKLILSTSAKVYYVFSGLTLYESVRLTANCEKFPHISSSVGIRSFVTDLELPGDSVILTAPTNQAVETAQEIGNLLDKKITKDKRLLPLRFDLEKIVSEEEFSCLGSEAFNVLRSRFLDTFFKDQLIDKQADFKKRYREFMLDVTGRYFDKTVIAVSHSYLIQLFFIYNKVGDRMFKDRNLLRKLFKPSKQFGFLKTIEMNISYN
jgi:hypothetical protein